MYILELHVRFRCSCAFENAMHILEVSGTMSMFWLFMYIVTVHVHVKSHVHVESFLSMSEFRIQVRSSCSLSKLLHVHPTDAS